MSETAGVVIEPWKESIFVEELEADGFEFEVNPPGEVCGEAMQVIHVKCDNQSTLAATVKRAQQRCRNSKKH